MYHNDFVVVLQDRNGNTLRETREGHIHLPFGTEYKFLFKNKSPKRAVVSVSIDGTDALGGSQIVISGNSTGTLERFILDGDSNKGKRFKFTDPETDPNVQDPGSSENGVVTVTVQYEKVRPPVMIIRQPWTFWRYDPWPTYYTYDIKSSPNEYFASYSSVSSTSFGNTTTNASSGATPTIGNASVNASINNMSNTARVGSSPAVTQRSVSVPGATVEGSESNQTFCTVSVGELEVDQTVFSFRLFGRKESNQKPVTIKPTNKVFCGGCGTQVRWEDNFCTQCGNPLGHK